MSTVTDHQKLVPNSAETFTDAMMAAVFESVDIGICVTDEAGLFVRVNRAFCKMFGYLTEELIGQHFTIVMPLEAHITAINTYRAYMGGQSDDWKEWKAMRKNGGLFDALITAKLMVREDGRRFKITTVNDVTESKKAEHALKKTLLEQKIILENAIVGICFSRDRKIVQCNRKFEQMFGYEAGEMAGRSYRIIYPNDAIFTSIREEIYATLSQGKTHETERLLVHKNGNSFWCNVAGKAIDPVRPYDGSIWIFEDITKRKLAEESLKRAYDEMENRVRERTAILERTNDALKNEIELRKRAEQTLIVSQKKYKLLFETLPIGISITDDQGNVIEANEASVKITGLSLEKQALKSSRDSWKALRPDGTPMLRKDLPSSRAFRENCLVEDEMGIAASPDDVRWVNVTAAPISIDGYGVAVAYSDITERRRIEAQKKQQEAELARVSRLNTMGEMVSALAHELSQPLAAMLNYLRGCERRMSNPNFAAGEVREALSYATKQAERAGSIINHIKQFIGKHKPQKDTIDVNQIVTEMVSFAEFDARNHNATIDIDLVEAVPPVRADKIEIGQVTINLIKNGIEAMVETPIDLRRIIVITELTEKGWVRVSVRDHGPGVPPDKAEQIFQPFFTTKADGMGFGLAICKSIIESHGGSLWVESNPDRGATFKFTLPPEEEI